MDSTGSPGYSQIPTKIFKFSAHKLAPAIMYLFNHYAVFSQVPSEWKTAIVTQLYKGKGDENDVTTTEQYLYCHQLQKFLKNLLNHRS